MVRECHVEGCGNVVHHGHECTPHWRQRSRGEAYHPVKRQRPPGLSAREVLAWNGWEVTESGCWEWSGGRNDRNYGQVRFGGKMTRAHRLSYETYIGEIPSGMVVRHICDNPPCINPAHLETGTLADNNRDKAERGRATSGGRSWSAKLSESEVGQILRQGGGSTRELAREFGVSPTTIRNIRNGVAWKHAAARKAAER